MRHTLKGFVLLVLVLLATTPSWAGNPALDSGWIPAQWPDICHSLGRPQTAARADKALEPWKAVVYSDMLRIVKHDIVCVGRVVVIDTPIFTNGGDVLIWGSSVVVDAAIDTRIYRPYTYEEHFLDPTADAGFAPNPANPVGFKNVRTQLESGKRPFTVGISKAFQDYYKCPNCRTVRDKRPATSRLPDGLTLPMWNGLRGADYRQSPGSAPIDEYIDFSEYKSGSITIITNSLSFSSTHKGPLLQARGASGGLGGAGEPPGCIGKVWEDETTLSCLPKMTAESALNGPGGRGGNAGSVRILLGPSVDALAIEGALERPGAAVADVSGGEPGPSTRLRTPSAQNFPFKGTIADFRSEGSWPMAQRGLAGKVDVIKLPMEMLFPEFYRAMRSFDGLPSYDLTEFAKRVRDDKSKDALSFDDYVASRLFQFLLGGLGLVVDKTAARIDGRTEVATTPAPLELCSLQSRPDMTSEQTWIAVLYLTELCRLQGDIVYGFLKGKGGLFNVSDWNAYTSFRTEKLEVAVSESQETWDKMLAKLGEIQAQLIDIYVSVETQRLTLAIKDLRDELARVEAQLEALRAKNQGNASFFKVIEVIAKAGTGVGDFADAVDVFQKDFALSKAQDVGKKGQGMVGAFQGLLGTLTKEDLTDSIKATEEERQRLRQGIAKLIEQRDRLIVEMARRKDSVIDTAASDLRSAIEARARYASRVRTRVAYFDDLYRLSILSYITDPARSVSVLASNLGNLKVFLRDFPRAQPSFRLHSAWHSCDRHAAWFRKSGCPRIGPLSETTIVDLRVGSLPFGTWTLPAYVVAPRDEELILESLELVFEKERVEAEPAASEGQRQRVRMWTEPGGAGRSGGPK